MNNDEHSYFLTAILLPNLEYQIELAKEKGLFFTVSKTAKGGLEICPVKSTMQNDKRAVEKLKLILKSNPQLTKVRH